MTKAAESGSKAVTTSTGAGSTTTSSSSSISNDSASLLKRIVTKNLRVQKRGGDAGAPLAHDGNNASIVLDEQLATETPWTPKSLGRAKTAIIYKQTLNDTLLVLERNIFFFSEWVPYFVSLQEDHVLLFKTRERWEQGLKPDKIIELHHMLMLGEMRVDVDGADAGDSDERSTTRLFRRKLLETDELDEWLNEELHQHLVVGSESRTGGVLSTNPNASARCVIEFAAYNPSTFELWTKAIRRVLQVKREQHVQDATRLRLRHHSRDDDRDASPANNNNASPSRRAAGPRAWVSPGQDSRLTLHQSEVWCHRVLSGEKEKAESELRRIVAMEKLVAQVTNPRMALLVYEKVSRVHELFVANSRREAEALDARAARLPADVLHFFADHLKRKYSVFLILALAYGVGEEQIREAHEAMCLENAAPHAGVGGGSGELKRPAASYGFEDPESLELYDKYRDAATNYHKMNYGDSAAAEEEDAIMHLPVMLQVAIVRRDHEETTAMLAIMEAVKARLSQQCVEQENNS
ncbi:hypothetical protein PybrP1_004829 [[Pythium] brassicae (nom. inval.)]|nr:hypothetical protein PybrP1_004829 [[Pythium] brassicae (nom. inval.)]